MDPIYSIQGRKNKIKKGRRNDEEEKERREEKRETIVFNVLTVVRKSFTAVRNPSGVLSVKVSPVFNVTRMMYANA